MQNVLLTRRYFITGSQRLSNFFWASLISFGGAAFLLTGFFSFLNRGVPSLPEANVSMSESFVTPEIKAGFAEQGLGLDLSDLSTSFSAPLVQGTDLLANNSIKFFPQGLIMCFYGSLGLIFGIYLWLSIFWKVGSGFNEFNKNTGVVRIFRWGLPGKNRQIDFQYKIKDIEALRVSLKEGINPRRTIALQVKGKGEIPLTRIGQPMPLQDIENQASELAQFLKVEIQVEN